ncbi:YtxH domain-containing protein [Macrococcus brunensis]|uniref:YtxH domain-containing protein n=1 Tax=Macrococcus brunensis TaxID=198483 RepID=A0A4R6BFU2_9STAP|nr:YtxH domain-containing protein [Macrococcus brunensis]TDL98623.1 YtxH domain-containing protein [Macrococcus brunensis]ULG73663.1 YtxH domain-containing protein [Macrococcus brunensis]
MNNKPSLLRTALVLGGTAVAAILSKKENRDMLVNEFNKAKQDPNAYKASLTEKANNLTQVAKEEVSKAKEDPNAYKANLTDKVMEKAAPVIDKVKGNEGDFPKNQADTREQVTTFDDEGGASNIHIVTDHSNVTDNNPTAVDKNDLK